MKIVRSCLDPSLQSSRGPNGQRKPPSILTVARMSLSERYKGHDYVIRAMPLLLRDCPELIYDVVGDGDGRAYLEGLARREGVAGAVRFHGIVPDETLLKMYREAALFVMPSRGEGFGFVFLEAQAQGTPAIGGNRDAAREVIRDGVTGYLVDPTSVEAIAAAVGRLLTDVALRETMGRAARLHVEQHFSYERFGRRLRLLLKE